MSACSSVSSHSNDRESLIDEDRSKSTSYGQFLSPSKMSRSHHLPRSRPGIQRSDHTSASVRQLEYDDCCGSFCSKASSSATESSTSTSRHFRPLSRRESFRSLHTTSHTQTSAVHESSLEMRTSFTIGYDTTPTTRSRRNSSNRSKQTLRFAPPSENLFVPIASIDDMTADEIENAWFSTHDYEKERASYQCIISLVEQHLVQKHSQTAILNGEVTTTALTASIKHIEGARGLENHTEVGARIAFRHRQQAFQAVLKEQEQQKKDRTIAADCEILKQADTALATAYAMETILSTLDAVERAMYDAKEAGVNISDPTILDIIAPSKKSALSLDQRFTSLPQTTKNRPLSNIPRKSAKDHDSISDSLHSLSSMTRRGFKPRPMPQRQPSSSILLRPGLRVNASNRNISYLTGAPPLAPQPQSSREQSTVDRMASSSLQQRVCTERMPPEESSSFRIPSHTRKKSTAEKQESLLCSKSYHSSRAGATTAQSEITFLFTSQSSPV